ncbi:GNAT family N-acetyltransferase [Mangrovihabitans endophyticus]|uniref:N-acetyltransferase n=1 Tax=Mangrovihabitans endophyticus TaxID=1751298 RepID=A0A8J3C7H3_9ACTN|nr:GNAT family N-acetyltransferase [Mangrovihabitans endophyticus]GGL18966.1 N-acetyltransferase [Mangrovihabitans endophyticus]
MESNYRIVKTHGETVPDAIQEMARLYETVYAEPPYNGGPLWQTAAFVERTLRQSRRPGFSLVTARSEDGSLIGYAFGVPFAENRWWSGQEATEPPQHIFAASKFALIELILAAPWRNRGIGHTMHDLILDDRDEPYGILTAVPNAPARELYRRWGWKQVGTARHTADSPVLDALAIELRPA